MASIMRYSLLNLPTIWMPGIGARVVHAAFERVGPEMLPLRLQQNKRQQNKQEWPRNYVVMIVFRTRLLPCDMTIFLLLYVLGGQESEINKQKAARRLIV